MVYILGSLSSHLFEPHSGSTHSGWNRYGGQVLCPPRRPKIATMLSSMCNASQSHPNPRCNPALKSNLHIAGSSHRKRVRQICKQACAGRKMINPDGTAWRRGLMRSEMSQEGEVTGHDEVNGADRIYSDEMHESMVMAESSCLLDHSLLSLMGSCHLNARSFVEPRANPLHRTSTSIKALTHLNIQPARENQFHKSTDPPTQPPPP